MIVEILIKLFPLVKLSFSTLKPITGNQVMFRDVIFPGSYCLKGTGNDLRLGYFDFFDTLTGLSLI